MNPYEQRRDEQIQKSKARLRELELGLGGAYYIGSPQQSRLDQKHKRARCRRVFTGPVRFSARLSAQARPAGLNQDEQGSASNTTGSCSSYSMSADDFGDVDEGFGAAWEEVFEHVKPRGFSKVIEYFEDQVVAAALAIQTTCTLMPGRAGNTLPLLSNRYTYSFPTA